MPKPTTPNPDPENADFCTYCTNWFPVTALVGGRYGQRTHKNACKPCWSSYMSETRQKKREQRDHEKSLKDLAEGKPVNYAHRVAKALRGDARKSMQGFVEVFAKTHVASIYEALHVALQAIHTMAENSALDDTLKAQVTADLEACMPKLQAGADAAREVPKAFSGFRVKREHAAPLQAPEPEEDEDAPEPEAPKGPALYATIPVGAGKREEAAAIKGEIRARAALGPGAHDVESALFPSEEEKARLSCDDSLDDL